MGVRGRIVVIALAAISASTVVARAGDKRRAEAKRHHHGAAPEELVTKYGRTVVNGCGPGLTQMIKSLRWRMTDKHTYYEGGRGFCEGLPPSNPSSCDGEEWTYQVDFHDACDLHDAGYEGTVFVIRKGRVVPQRLVYDKILDEDIDYTDKSRKWVDDHFLQDMAALCDQQIVRQPGNSPFADRAWTDALAACKGSGQPPVVGGPWGAQTMWHYVRAFGAKFFKSEGGQRVNDHLDDLSQ